MIYTCSQPATSKSWLLAQALPTKGNADSNTVGGYALSAPSDTIASATPLIQYILPAVIFSMTIPRRLVLEPHKWLFDFRPNNILKLNNWPQCLFSFCVAGLIATADTALWVFTIMIAPAPFIFSGLLEVVLDSNVIWHLQSSHEPRGGQVQSLSKIQRVQLLTSVLGGNLAREGVPANPQSELGDVLDIVERPEETEVHLRAMLACQYPFGAAVGAPILLYIGSFIYNILTLHNAEGDRATAEALAFGIWWMNIVHVAAISACLLASSNPSTAAAIGKKRKVTTSFEDRLRYAGEWSEMEDRIQARLEALSRLPLCYRARYEPVWMWTRGKSKAGWLRETEAWKQSWFRKKIELTIQDWVALTFFAYLLVLLPGALAFWIVYTTHPRGIGCRALTILVYTGAQLAFVVLSAWSHFKVARDEQYWRRHTWLDRLRRKWVGIAVAILLLLPAWISAVFTTIAGTLMELSGIYENCLCESTGYWTFGSNSTVSLATDTAQDRDSSWHWKVAGYIALSFLSFVTYLAWWCQRYLREKFVDCVKHLVAPPESTALLDINEHAHNHPDSHDINRQIYLPRNYKQEDD